jgi:hypothetical protein
MRLWLEILQFIQRCEVSNSQRRMNFATPAKSRTNFIGSRDLRRDAHCLRRIYAVTARTK